MTSFAFILGVVPLMVASGAGAASQRAIGTVVFGGMMASTLLAIPFVPVFYVLLEGMSERLRRGRGFTRQRQMRSMDQPLSDRCGSDEELDTTAPGVRRSARR